MLLIESLMVALSTYSVIPVPNFNWNENNMKYAICFFPVIGVFCGILMWVLGLLNISSFFASIIATCIPLLVTGGIHMDGFMDTVDALSSHRPKERKLEILKDPNCGAFACIYMGIYLLLSVGLFYEIYSLGCIFSVCPVFVLSRCVSTICSVNLPNAKKEGMLLSYTKDVKKITVNITMSVVIILTIAVMLLISSYSCIIPIVLGLLWIIIYSIIVKKQFGGVTGDTAGFFLQIFELLAIFGIWIGAII